MKNSYNPLPHWIIIKKDINVIYSISLKLISKKKRKTNIILIINKHKALININYKWLNKTIDILKNIYYNYKQLTQQYTK